MKKGQDGNQTNLIQWIILFGSLLFFLTISLMSYSATMKEESKEKVEDKLVDEAQLLGNEFSAEIRRLEQVGITVAAILSKEETFSINNVQQTLDDIVETTSATSAFVASTDGIALSDSGNKFSISKENYYTLALGNTENISEAYVDEKTGEYVVTIAVPINNGSGVKGVLGINYPTGRFMEIPNTSDHDSKTMYLLIKNDGTIIGTAGYRSSSTGLNLFDYLKNASFEENESVDTLIRNIQNGKSGMMSCNFVNNGKSILYKPVGINGWFCIELLTKKYVVQLQDRIYQPTKSVLFKIVLSLSLFFASLLMINFINRAIHFKESRELQDKAETDLLTGLLNKIATEKHIEEYLEGPGKDKEALMFVLDIDNFKKINDTMGHAFGDEVLSTLGKRIKGEFRISDIVGRIGGDEFIVFLKDIKDDETRKREAARVSNFFKVFQAGEYVKYSATASIGAAVYPDDGTNFEELYKAADKAVYKAKRRGKNQLAFFKDGEVEEEI